MNILITGARAPIAVDLARSLLVCGHRVWVADSVARPIGSHAPGIAGFVRLPAPRFDAAGFADALRETCRELAVERVIPTSEEVFWLAGLRAQGGWPPGTNLWTAPFATLARLHHKAQFAALANDVGYGAGPCEVFTSPLGAQQVAALGATRPLSDWVFKPVYSRFGTRTLIGPSTSEVARLAPSRRHPWLAQRCIRGEEVCVYALAEAGRLLDLVAYRPRYRAGSGASAYFDPVRDERLAELAQAFIAASRFTGQIAFDVIDEQGRLVALECNPRGTSGAHLMAQFPERFGRLLAGQAPAPAGEPAASGPEPAARMLALPVLLYHPQLLLSRAGRADFARAADALRGAGVGFGPQLSATVAMLAGALGRRMNPLDFSTRDFEWNGEPMPFAPRAPAAGGVPPRSSSQPARVDSHRGWERFLREGLLDAPGLVRNAHYSMETVEAGRHVLPVAVSGTNRAAASWVLSLRNAFGPYARAEADIVSVSPALKPLFLAASHAGEALLRAGALDAGVYVNNWLLATNLYPADIDASQLIEACEAVARRHPQQAIVLRSLTAPLHGRMLAELVRAGLMLLPTRQVWLSDALACGGWRQHRDVRRDLRLDARTPSACWVPGHAFGPEDFARAAWLYDQLYRVKYPAHNPDYDVEFLRRGVATGLLQLEGLRLSPEAPLSGIVGVIERDGVFATPVLGYDLTVPAERGLYRLLMLRAFKAAEAARGVLHCSAGAGAFKAMRGARAHVEFAAIWAKHLPRSSRASLRVLERLLNALVVPYLTARIV